MYVPNTERYAAMAYRRCGKSGLKLPEVSLGLWHNFGDTNTLEHMEAICKAAFDGGITHFDLANNYGPPAGAAEQNFGKILKTLFAGYRDELIISTKAGFDMWEGPYGNWGSRKYLLASLDQSLKRMGLEYVDIFYHHRPDPETPLEETMGALAQAVQSGKALYVGLSNYDGATMQQACAILKELHCPFVINQNCYSMLNRTIERSANLNKITTGIIQSYKLLPTCKFCQFGGISDEILTRFIFRKQSIYIKFLEIQFHHVIEWRRSLIQCFPPYVGILQNKSLR